MPDSLHVLNNLMATDFCVPLGHLYVCVPKHSADSFYRYTIGKCNRCRKCVSRQVKK